MSSARSLVLVAGSGRSGTSLVAGILQRLGSHVPAPEVPADPSNPRGFAESQGVVDLHTRLLRGAGVAVSDARPAAWGATARVCLDSAVQDEVGRFLAAQFARAPDLVIKDPRLSWFLPVWRRAAERAGVTPRVLVMLRHPAAVIASKQSHYGGRQSEAARAAGWLNQLLFTERATRDSPRVLLRYEHLLADWTAVVGGAGEALDLAPVRHASAQAIRRAHEFIDVTLDRSRPNWDELAVPSALQGLCEQVYDQLLRLAADPTADARARLDDLRAQYTAVYAEAEAIAYSSVAAATVRARPAPGPSLSPSMRSVARRVPVGVRHAVPVELRRRVVRALAG